MADDPNAYASPSKSSGRSSQGTSKIPPGRRRKIGERKCRACFADDEPRPSNEDGRGTHKALVPYDAFAAGIGDYRIVTTLCPGGKERMRRLMNLVQTGRFDPLPLLTHRFSLDQIIEAYELFGERRDGVLKVAIRP
jgi:hypothetical protein